MEINLQQQKINDLIENNEYHEVINFITQYTQENINKIEEDEYREFLSIDPAMYHIFKNLHNDDIFKISLYKKLPDIFLFMNDPRILFSFLVESFNDFDNNKELAFFSSLNIFYLIKHFNVEVTTFYEIVFEIITKEIIEKFTDEVLTFIKIILNESNVSLHTKMVYIKKLARISLDIDTNAALNILNLILIMMRLNPTCFMMVNDRIFYKDNFSEIENDMLLSFEYFQPYLFEFDLLSCGIQPIRKIINIIRNESYKIKEKNDRETLISSNFSARLEDCI